MTNREEAKGKVIRVPLREASLRRKIRQHLKKIGFSKNATGLLEFKGEGKDIIRSLHAPQRRERIESSKDFIDRLSPKLLKYFASGSEIDPAKISPTLEKVHAGTWQSDLFRLASLTWSVPVSNGFGRRIRYLVWDAYNEKLIGLIAIGDPVFNLSVRDRLIGWNAQERGSRLVNIMDAYVLGALPPYNALLGGKMVACLIRSRDVYNEFAKSYGETIGIISGEKKNASLLTVTTSSSMGRSSVYNRLKLNGTSYFDSIGYTGGWGHFHIPDDLFCELRSYLRHIGHGYADLHQFGQGPNWRLRTTRAALSALGFKEDLLRHGIQREVFICTLAENSFKILRTGKGRPDLSNLLAVSEIAELAKERWILPRAQRRQEFKAWTNGNVLRLLSTNERQYGTPQTLLHLG